MLRFEPSKAGQRQLKRILLCAIFLLTFSLTIYKLNQPTPYQEATEKLLRIFGNHDPVPLITFPNQETTLIQPRNLCKLNNDTGEEPFFLYMVISSPRNFDLRYFIRNKLSRNFANTTITRKSVKLLFFIGVPTERSIKRLLKDEANDYGDIILEDFQESYLNLTLKSMRVLKWFNVNCKSSRYLIKADDDIHLNLKLFFEEMIRLTDGQGKRDDLIAGYPLNELPSRDPQDKHFIPYELWPEPTYPQYAALEFYTLSRSTASKIYNASLELKIPLFPIENVYVNGLLGNRALGIQTQAIKGFVLWGEDILTCDVYNKIALTFVHPNDLNSKLKYLNCLSFYVQNPKSCYPDKGIGEMCSIFDPNKIITL